MSHDPRYKLTACRLGSWSCPLPSSPVPSTSFGESLNFRKSVTSTLPLLAWPLLVLFSYVHGGSAVERGIQSRVRSYSPILSYASIKSSPTINLLTLSNLHLHPRPPNFLLFRLSSWPRTPICSKRCRPCLRLFMQLLILSSPLSAPSRLQSSFHSPIVSSSCMRPPASFPRYEIQAPEHCRRSPHMRTPMVLTKFWVFSAGLVLASLLRFIPVF